MAHDGPSGSVSAQSWCVSRMESVWLQAIMDAATAVQSMALKGVMRRRPHPVQRSR